MAEETKSPEVRTQLKGEGEGAVRKKASEIEETGK